MPFIPTRSEHCAPQEKRAEPTIPDSTILNGKEAIERFNAWPLHLQEKHVKKIFASDRAKFPGSAAGEEFTYNRSSLPYDGSRPVILHIAAWLLSRHFFAQDHYRHFRRALLSASVFAGRPLSFDEIQWIAFWAERYTEWRWDAGWGYAQLGLGGLAVKYATMPGRNKVVKGFLLTVAILALCNAPILRVLSMPPSSCATITIRDDKGVQLQAALKKDILKLMKAKMARSLTDEMAARDMGHWDRIKSRFRDDEWLRIKYQASAFVKGPCHQAKCTGRVLDNQASQTS